MSGKPLKVKDLMPVKFTPIADGDDKTKSIAKKVRYMCPITHDALTNTTRCAFLKTSLVSFAFAINRLGNESLQRKSHFLRGLSYYRFRGAKYIPHYDALAILVAFFAPFDLNFHSTD